MTTGPRHPPCPQCGTQPRLEHVTDAWLPEGNMMRKQYFKCVKGHKSTWIQVEIGMLRNMLDEASNPPVIGKVDSESTRVVKLDGSPFKEI